MPTIVETVLRPRERGVLWNIESKLFKIWNLATGRQPLPSVHWCDTWYKRSSTSLLLCSSHPLPGSPRPTTRITSPVSCGDGERLCVGGPLVLLSRGSEVRDQLLRDQGQSDLRRRRELYTAGLLAQMCRQWVTWHIQTHSCMIVLCYCILHCTIVLYH